MKKLQNDVCNDSDQEEEFYLVTILFENDIPHRNIQIEHQGVICAFFIGGVSKRVFTYFLKA